MLVQLLYDTISSAIAKILIMLLSIQQGRLQTQTNLNNELKKDS